MAGGPSLASSGAILVLAIFAAFFYTAELPRAKVVLGFGRKQGSTVVANANDFHTIPDTVHCEDLHYHEPSRLIFTACEGVEATRYAWFPALGHFDDPNVGLKAQGSIEVIDPNVGIHSLPSLVTATICVVLTLSRADNEGKEAQVHQLQRAVCDAWH